MAKVFWLMWLSDVVGSIGFIGAIAAILLGLSLVFAGVISACDEKGDALLVWAKASKWLWPVVFVAAIIPGQKTVQLLAITSASEAAASTQLGKKGIEALNTILDGVISGQTKKADR